MRGVRRAAAANLCGKEHLKCAAAAYVTTTLTKRIGGS